MKPSEMLRSAKSSLMIASALVCAGCLVTNELDFELHSTPPMVRRIAPPGVSAVPSMVGSEECQESRPDSLYLEAQYFDEDVDQRLYAVPYVNGRPLSFAQGFYVIEPDPLGTPLHQDPIVCIPRDLLTQPCNRVSLFVSDDLNALLRPPEALLNDPKVDYVDWALIPPASDTLGGAGKPYTSVTECLPSTDGGA